VNIPIQEPNPNGKERVEVQDAREPAYATKLRSQREKVDMPQGRNGAKFVRSSWKLMRCGVPAVDTGYGPNQETASTRIN